MSAAPETAAARVAAIFHSAGFLSTPGIAVHAVDPTGVRRRSPSPTLIVSRTTTSTPASSPRGRTTGAAARAALPPGKDVLTLELKINFLLPDRSGRLEARGRTLRAGRSVAVAESKVFAVSGTGCELIAKLVSTLAVLDEPRADGATRYAAHRYRRTGNSASSPGLSARIHDAKLWTFCLWARSSACRSTSAFSAYGAKRRLPHEVRPLSLRCEAPPSPVQTLCLT